MNGRKGSPRGKTITISVKGAPCIIHLRQLLLAPDAVNLFIFNFAARELNYGWRERALEKKPRVFLFLAVAAAAGEETARRDFFCFASKHIRPTDDAMIAAAVAKVVARDAKHDPFSVSFSLAAAIPFPTPRRRK